MATFLLTEHADICCVRRRTGPLAGLLARMLGWSLDGALASGRPPDSSTLLSLRARRLIGPDTRRQLAGELHALLDDARRPYHPSSPRVPVCRRNLLQAGELVEELAERLRAPYPVDARGVALVRRLLRDGTSPLYGRAADTLNRAIETALEALEPALD